MDEEADFLARLTLHHVIEPADPVFGRLQEHSEPDQLLAAIKNASLPDLEPDPARRDRVADRALGYRLRLEQVDLEASIATAQTIGARYLTPGREHWPTAFDDLGPERPLGVWWLGTWLPTDGAPVAAVVGARACTGYGSYVAGTIAAALGQAGVPVASGGALGIDAAAHRGALAVGGDTIAFLACGIDLAYPRTNEMLLRAIRSHGAVVSELPPGCHPNRFRFLTRNRLIAAIGTATVVVEAAKRSGSLVTARRAGDLGRLVLSVPGPITSELSVGTHELIRDGAQVVESPQQVTAELIGSQPRRPQPTNERRPAPAGSEPGTTDAGRSSTARPNASADSSNPNRSEPTELSPAGPDTEASEAHEPNTGNSEARGSDLDRSDLGRSHASASELSGFGASRSELRKSITGRSGLSESSADSLDADGSAPNRSGASRSGLSESVIGRSGTGESGADSLDADGSVRSGSGGGRSGLSESGAGRPGVGETSAESFGAGRYGSGGSGADGSGLSESGAGRPGVGESIAESLDASGSVRSGSSVDCFDAGGSGAGGSGAGRPGSGESKANSLDADGSGASESGAGRCGLSGSGAGRAGVKESSAGSFDAGRSGLSESGAGESGGDSSDIGRLGIGGSGRAETAGLGNGAISVRKPDTPRSSIDNAVPWPWPKSVPRPRPTSPDPRPSIWSNWSSTDAAQAADPARSDPGLLSSLGPTERIVLEALPTVRTGGMQIPELSGATGIEPGLVFAGLGRLAGLGLAAKNGSGWVLAPGQERKARRYE